MTGLQQRLDALRAGFQKKAPLEAVELMHRSTSDLADRLEKDEGLGVGDSAPGFRLPDHNGNTVDSAELLSAGPLVLTFFRGHW